MPKSVADLVPRYRKLLARMLDASSAPAERAKAREAVLSMDKKHPGLRAEAMRAHGHEVVDKAQTQAQQAPGTWGVLLEHATALFGHKAVDFLTTEMDWSMFTEEQDDDDDDDEELSAEESDLVDALLDGDWKFTVYEDDEGEGDEEVKIKGTVLLEDLREASENPDVAAAFLAALVQSIDDAS